MLVYYIMQSDYIQYKKQYVLWNDRSNNDSTSSSYLMHKQFYLENNILNTIPVYSKLTNHLVFDMEKTVCSDISNCPYLVNRKLNKRLFDNFAKYTPVSSVSSRHANTSGQVLRTKICPFFKNRVPSIKGNYCVPAKI